MAARRGKKKGLSEENNALLQAVSSAVSIQKGSGLTDRQTHCRFFNGYVVATNNVQMIGIPVTGIAVDCCPHSKTLIAALERCTEATTFTLEGSTLVVASGKVRVPVPCLDQAALSDLYPDGGQGKAGEALAEALGVVAGIVDDADERHFCRPVYMGADLVQGTHKGHINVQVFHGVNPLPDIALPKETALSISKHTSKLVALGLGPGTATFWFEDSSFIRTSLHDIKCPAIDRTLERKKVCDPTPVNASLFEAVRTMAPFVSAKLAETGNANALTFSEGKVWAGMYENPNVASFEYPDSPIKDVTINSEYLLMFEGIAESVVCDEFERRIYFYGQRFRAVIATMGNR